MTMDQVQAGQGNGQGTRDRFRDKTSQPPLPATHVNKLPPAGSDGVSTWAATTTSLIGSAPGPPNKTPAGSCPSTSMARISPKARSAKQTFFLLKLINVIWKLGAFSSLDRFCSYFVGDLVGSGGLCALELFLKNPSPCSVSLTSTRKYFLCIFSTGRATPKRRGKRWRGTVAAKGSPELGDKLGTTTDWRLCGNFPIVDY